MHGQESTAEALTPDLEERLTVEQILNEFKERLPETVTLLDCFTVRPDVLPYSIGKVRPHCFWCNHLIPTQWVWTDVATGKTYCTERCVAAAAIDACKMVAIEERLIP